MQMQPHLLHHSFAHHLELLYQIGSWEVCTGKEWPEQEGPGRPALRRERTQKGLESTIIMSPCHFCSLWRTSTVTKIRLTVIMCNHGPPVSFINHIMTKGKFGIL